MQLRLKATLSKVFRGRKSDIFLSTGFAISSLVLAFTLSWLVLAQQNFLYPVWHDIGGIGAGIDKFGPKNKFKPGFGDTTKAQRTQIFEQINRAVHRHGQGLTAITYQTSSSNGDQRLLLESEVVHLQDVSNLLSLLSKVVAANALLWLVLALMIYRIPRRILAWHTQVGGVCGLILLSLIVVLLIGPEKVFNQLHIWVFPEGHQWFFYYQESLMSTLMLAPTLFGWIAAALVVAALCVFLSLVSLSIYIEGTLKGNTRS